MLIVIHYSFIPDSETPYQASALVGDTFPKDANSQVELSVSSQYGFGHARQLVIDAFHKRLTEKPILIPLMERARV